MNYFLNTESVGITSNVNRFFPGYVILSMWMIMVVGLFSCSKEPVRPHTDDPDPDPGDSLIFSEGFFVVNEGNFNWGNASITFIDTVTGGVYQDIFQIANDRPLGDVAQSMKVMNNRGYILMNASNRLEVVDLKDFTTIKSITGFNAPRYIEFIDSTKAYVTNLYKDISVVDLEKLEVTKTIPTPEWTEGMVRYNQYMFVTCIGEFSEPSSRRKAKLLIINTKNDEIADSIQSSTEPVAIVIDKKQKMWILCSGGWDSYSAPALIRVNPELRQVEKTFVFSTTATPSRLAINPTRDTIYFLKDGIYQMPVTATELPTEPLITSDGRLFYGLAIHPVNGTIYATDAIDYVQAGHAYQFSSSTGAKLHDWETGTIPGSFCFGE